MDDRPFLTILYRHYFEYGGKRYMFVAFEGRTSIVGRLYSDTGLYSDFDIPIANDVREGLSSNSPVNPFERYIRSAKRFIDAIE